MELTVFLTVLFAAALHASWNALVKGTGDKLAAITAITIGQGSLALVTLPFLPIPAMESWPYLAIGIVLHVGYRIFLAESYRFGDLTQVYPIARGSAPLIVATVSLLFLNEDLNRLTLIAILLVAVAIMSLAFTRGAQGLRDTRSAMMALITGCFIAGYSIFDGLGARVAGNATAFWCWLSFCDTIIFISIIRLKRGVSLSETLRGQSRNMIIGGVASFLAYWLVILAFTQPPLQP